MKPKLHNKTRVSTSIPKRLIQEKKFYLLPLYWIMKTSFLANEAITNSGSYLLADHIYVGQPKGTWGIGLLLDHLLLSLPSAKSFRNRYLYIKKELQPIINKKTKLTILTIPCGIPRDHGELMQESLQRLTSIDYTCICMDLDKKVLLNAAKYMKVLGVLANTKFLHGNALEKSDFPQNLDIVTSTGLGEFFDDQSLVTFYKNVHYSLSKNGIFITSAIDKHAFSDFLLREIGEVFTNYRQGHHMRKLLNRAGFTKVVTYTDQYNLQTMAIAFK